MRLLFVTHYYAPEIGAPQTRLRETIRLLRDAGDECRVVTNHPHYPSGGVRAGYRPWTVRHDVVDGVQVLRLPVIARPNSGFANRVVDQASFAALAAAAVPSARWADVLIVESPPLFLGFTARWLSGVSGRPYVLHVADPWPDYPIELGALTSPLAIRAARALERWAYAGASAITAPTAGVVYVISKQPQAAGKTHVIPNGVDTRRFLPDMPPQEARQRLGWDEGFTVTYAGTVGLAQGLQTLLHAAVDLERLTPSSTQFPMIRVVGAGVEREALAGLARDRGLQRISFEEPVASDRIPEVLAASDALVVMLRAGRLAEAALPTKLVEGMAAGRPLLVSGAGEAAGIVLGAHAGAVCGAEDGPALAQAILRLSTDTVVTREMGRAARDAAVREFDRPVIVQRLRAILDSSLRVRP